MMRIDVLILTYDFRVHNFGIISSVLGIASHCLGMYIKKNSETQTLTLSLMVAPKVP